MSKIKISEQESPFKNFKETSNGKIQESDLDIQLAYIDQVEETIADYFKSFVSLKRDKMANFGVSNQQIEKDLTQFEITINNTLNKVVYDTENKNVKLLVVGNVQSGKTDFMLGLSTKLFDSKKDLCNLLFILSTANTTLLNQTYERFKTIFAKINLDRDFFTYSKLKEESEDSYSKIIKNIYSGKKVVVFLQKQKDHLKIAQKLLEALSKTRQDNKYTNGIVIFDDEGDASSFDNNQQDEQSTINKNLTELIDKSSKFGSTFISITATPFAHIMVEKEYNIKPDYGFILEPGTGYLGLKFFSEKSEEKISKIIKPIEGNSENFFTCYDYEGAIALTHYLVQCFIFFHYKDKYLNRKPRMMINIAREKESHFEIQRNIEEMLCYWKKHPTNLEDNIEKIMVDYEELSSLKTRESTEKIRIILIKKIFPFIEVKVLNSDEKSNNNIKLDEPNYESFEIIIGSDKLGRGLTFVDLTMAFVLRRSKEKSNADTVLQLARWFGYRDDYKNLLKIFLSNDLIDDFNLTNYATNELFSLIKEFEISGRPINEMPQIFPLERIKYDYGATRKSVVETYWQTGPKSSYMNNRYEWGEKNLVKAINDDFFKKFIELFEKTKEIDQNEHPIINFKSVEEFNQEFFNTNNKNILYKKYNDLFGIPLTSIATTSKRNLVDRIIEEDSISNVVVRFIYKRDEKEEENGKEAHATINIDKIYWRERKLNISDNKELKYYSFGQGNYVGEDLFIKKSKANSLYIDIIPVSLWTDNEEIIIKNKNQTRARLFIPNNLIKSRLGLVSKK